MYAYKRDCFAVDQIRLVLGDDRRQSWMEVTEDDAGFKVLIEELARRLPDSRGAHDWWDKVASPAFQTNWTQLYRRIEEPNQLPFIEQPAFPPPDL